MTTDSKVVVVVLNYSSRSDESSSGLSQKLAEAGANIVVCTGFQEMSDYDSAARIIHIHHMMASRTDEKSEREGTDVNYLKKSVLNLAFEFAVSKGYINLNPVTRIQNRDFYRICQKQFKSAEQKALDYDEGTPRDPRGNSSSISIMQSRSYRAVSL